jgi:protein-tyrosine-phosphatase
VTSMSDPLSAPRNARRRRQGDPLRILFLCTANSARSQIAEALLLHKTGEEFIVASAGTEPALQVRPEAVAALRDIGIDWSGQPKGFDAVSAERWDIVITLCDRLRESCPTLPDRAVTAHWGVPDPTAKTDPMHRALAFRETVALLAWRLDLMLALPATSLERLALEERLRSIPAQDANRSPTPGK